MIGSIVDQAGMLLPLILGAYITLSLLKLPDFSLESAYLFGAVMAYMAKDQHLAVVLGSALLGGMCVGAVVCTLNQCLRLPFLLAAIVTNGLFHGLTQYLLGSSMVSFHPFAAISELPFFLLIDLFLVIVLGYGLRSQLGYSFAVYGNNPSFFQHHAVSGQYVLFSGVMLGHGCAGISGFLFAGSNGFVDLTMSFGTILLCLTALILGKLCIKSHRSQVLVPVLGVVMYFVIQQTLLRLGLNLRYFNAFQALFVMTVLGLGYRKQKLTLDHLGV